MKLLHSAAKMVPDPVCGALTGDGIDDLVQRYHARVRPNLRRLMVSPRFCDVARVFPALAFAIAARRGPLTQRRRALDLIEAGAEIKEAARAVGLPMWLRRLPPEAFDDARLNYPRSETFSRRITNHMPTRAEESALWLRCVTFASEAANDYTAIWLAQQNVFHGGGDAQRLLSVLCAYAWFSTNEQARAHSFVVIPWRPEMAVDTAVCAAKCWLNRVRLSIQLTGGVIDDPWLEPGDALGLTFEPLQVAHDILAEAHHMRNCADQYADRLARDKCRLFSVRRRGQRIATLEIGPHPRENGILAIAQLKGRHNQPAPLDVWQATHAWLSKQNNLRRMPAMSVPDRPFNQELWQSLMLPYRLAANGAPWMPDTLTQQSLISLDQGLAELARRGGVSSWLFT